jgi:Zn-dependent peptidase ImmA (M78 family)
MNKTIQILRDAVPVRALTFSESLRVAELQASKLLALAGITEPSVPESVIAQLPRIQIERMSPAPVSGATHWSHGRWLIVVNGSEPRTRQRYSAMHEFKHILDNPFIEYLYPATSEMTTSERAEQICDYFAACVLVPRIWLKRAWVGGDQSAASLARRFDVSRAAMSVRLRQIGLVQPDARCEGPARITA